MISVCGICVNLVYLLLIFILFSFTCMDFPLTYVTNSHTYRLILQAPMCTIIIRYGILFHCSCKFCKRILGTVRSIAQIRKSRASELTPQALSDKLCSRWRRAYPSLKGRCEEPIRAQHRESNLHSPPPLTVQH